MNTAIEPPSKELVTATARRAMQEDLPDGFDLTTQMLSLAGRAEAKLLSCADGVLAGTQIAGWILEPFDEKLRIDWSEGMFDGVRISAGQTLATVRGPTTSLLAAERSLLNFLCMLSGIATLTSRFVAEVAGTKARIYDTRKTAPSLRELQKYAVRCGGGCNHRMGLHEAVLIKDNHLAAARAEELAPALRQWLKRLERLGRPVAFVEVEVQNLRQLQEVLSVGGLDVVMLDNFSPEQLTEAVRLRDRFAAGVALEASGNITLANVRQVAEIGVERIAVGALTHSAPALDMSLELVAGRS